MALTDIDRNLLKRCIAEEPGGWREFVDRFLALFVHVIQHTAHARSVRLAPADIDDLCAEVFLVLLADDYAVLRQFRGRSSLATYLTVIARRIVVREIARRRKAEASRTLRRCLSRSAPLHRFGPSAAHVRTHGRRVRGGRRRLCAPAKRRYSIGRISRCKTQSHGRVVGDYRVFGRCR